MSTTKDTWKNKHTVICSLKAPKGLAIRPSGDKKGQQYRSVFMRDRDRILYSKSFRRLSGKTQVYLSGSDDHKRTRLTHTLEVAQIAKTIANNLKLDLDLTEAIALGHDIGHAPFGHAGERILHEIITPTTGDKPLINSTPMKVNLPKKSLKFCGFKHNLQSVLVALELEKDYDEYGLDLTNFTLYGMYSHSSKIYKKGKNADQLHYYNRFDKYLHLADSSIVAWSFEAFVVREADEIAQCHHDLEDAIRGNLISKEEVVNQLENHFGAYIKNGDRKTLKKMKNATDDELYISLLSRLIVNLLVTRITKCSIYNMNKFIIENKLSENKFATYMLNHTPSDAENLISYDCNDDNYSHFKSDMKQFADFISTKVLSSYDIQTADAHGQYIIQKIFQAYFKTPTQLPDHCIIEYYTHIDNPPFVEIPKIISEKGMGEIRSQFSKDFSENLNDDELFVLMRVICNQIAGMTDAYAQKTYNSLYS